MRIRATVFVALLLTPAGGAAQTPALPLVSFDALLGYSRTPPRVGPNYYESTHTTAARLALAVRLGSRGAVRPVVVLDYSGMIRPNGDDASCEFAPNGTCLKRFPEFSGFGAGLGLRAAVGQRVVFGATGGASRYQDRYTTNSGRRTAFFVDAEVAAMLGRRLGVVMNVRHVEMPKADGARVWFRPLTIGLRIQ